MSNYDSQSDADDNSQSDADADNDADNDGVGADDSGADDWGNNVCVSKEKDTVLCISEFLIDIKL